MDTFYVLTSVIIIKRERMKMKFPFCNLLKITNCLRRKKRDVTEKLLDYSAETTMKIKDAPIGQK